jgi:hypothetical protein
VTNLIGNSWSIATSFLNYLRTVPNIEQTKINKIDEVIQIIKTNYPSVSDFIITQNDIHWAYNGPSQEERYNLLSDEQQNALNVNLAILSPSSVPSSQRKKINSSSNNITKMKKGTFDRLNAKKSQTKNDELFKKRTNFQSTPSGGRTKRRSYKSKRRRNNKTKSKSKRRRHKTKKRAYRSTRFASHK